MPRENELRAPQEGEPQKNKERLRENIAEAGEQIASDELMDVLLSEFSENTEGERESPQLFPENWLEKQSQQELQMLIDQQNRLREGYEGIPQEISRKFFEIEDKLKYIRIRREIERQARSEALKLMELYDYYAGQAHIKDTSEHISFLQELQDPQSTNRNKLLIIKPRLEYVRKLRDQRIEGESLAA